MERIAIVGLGAVLPSCQNLREFWSSVLEGRDLSSSVPEGRWGSKEQVKKYLQADGALDHIPHDHAYFVRDHVWDKEGLAIDEELLSQLDPLFHYALHAGRDAFFDCQWSTVDRSRAGVILGNLALPSELSSRFVHTTLGRSFHELQFDNMEFREAAVEALNYFPASMPSATLAKALGFGGKSLSLDAACASSLYAIKFACDELLSHRASFMLAGGLCRPDSLFTQMGFTQLQALSPSGKSRPFDSKADGLMVGEGAAILGLKRLSDALAAGDRIYGLIAGIGLSNDMDGRLMAPSAEGQLRAMRAAYQQAGWGPEEITYLECHATGTQLGDQTELKSWLQVREETAKAQRKPCVLSSSKGNVGHLLTASGAVGLVRLLLCLQEKILPPTANFAALPHSLQQSMAASNCRILKEPELWESEPGKPRRAAISAFGFGGTNAHLLLEEWLPEGSDNQIRSAPFDTPVSQPEPVAIVGIGFFSGSERNLGQPESWLESCQQSAKLAKLWYGAEGQSWLAEQLKNRDFHTCSWRKLQIPFGEFRIPPQEFPDMLPQQIAMLLAAAQASRDAGWQAAERPHTGIFVGLDVDGMANAFYSRWSLATDCEKYLKAHTNSRELSEEEKVQWLQSLREQLAPPLTANRVLGSLASLVASRIAREYRCGGMGLTVSMMENSGLMALDRAIQLLRSGEIQEAMVGAVDRASQLPAVLARHLLRSSQGLESQEFIEDMAVALVLKKQSEALRDGDKIYGLIHEIQSGNSASNRQAPLGDVPASPIPRVHNEGLTQGMASGLTALLEALVVHAKLPDKQAGSRLLEFSYGSVDGNIIHVLLEPNRDNMYQQKQSQQQQAADKKGIDIEIPGAKAWQKIDLLPTKGASFADAQPADEAARSRQTPLRNAAASGVKGQQAKLQRPETGHFLTQLASITEKAALAEQQAQMMHMELQSQYTQHMASILDCILADQRLGEVASLSEDLTPSAPISIKQAAKETPLFDYDDCNEFAVGLIQNVFGPDFAEVDQYPSRVRLPFDRLLLCHRVMDIQGEARSLSRGVLISEHDVTADSWYLDHNRIPTAIAIEAGQADLMLSAWLGADFHTKGQAVYRLLDAKVVFHDMLPQVGDVIRYHITIENFFKQAQTLFLRFRFHATVNGKTLMTMEDGCAGFFTPEELEAGRGIVKPGFMNEPQGVHRKTGSYEHLFDFPSESYSAGQLDALREGDLAACFGPQFQNLPIANPLTIPGGDLRLVHRINELDPKGGWFGLGLVIGEADIHPDDWFLTCHFKDDHVMPGTLMYECCLHTLRVFLLRMGWVAAKDQVTMGPVTGVKSQLKCRGQVISQTKRVRYELHIREMGYDPDAYVLANALMYSDDKLIVDIHNMNFKLQGLKRQDVLDLWSRKVERAPCDDESRPLFSQEQILEFSSGLPSRAFGPAYRCFDEGRRMARLPRPPYQFITEVISTADLAAWQMQAHGRAKVRYCIPERVWYLKEEPGQKMPFSILLEVGLQACGWMAAYMGSALHSEQDLFFRNLQGEGQLLQLVGEEHKNLLTEVECLNVSQSAGMILQSYRFQIYADDALVYRGQTSFGFFSEKALSEQKGLRPSEVPALPNNLPAESQLPHINPTNAWSMVDGLYHFDPTAGLYQKGRALAYKKVRGDEWFFEAHFYQDPVMPGSLGLEGFIQLMRQCAQVFWPASQNTKNWHLQAGSEQEWIYRGQVRPHASLIWYDLHVKHVEPEKQTLVADGYLWVDGLPIYGIKNFILS